MILVGNKNLLIQGEFISNLGGRHLGIRTLWHIARNILKVGESARLAAPESIVRAHYAAGTGGTYCLVGLCRAALACCAEVKRECRLA